MSPELLELGPNSVSSVTLELLELGPNSVSSVTLELLELGPNSVSSVTELSGLVVTKFRYRGTTEPLSSAAW